MKIPITEAHITKAKRRDSRHCMIADAIADRCHGQFVMVDAQSIRWSDPKSETENLTP